jgi:hypothetical protein
MVDKSIPFENIGHWFDSHVNFFFRLYFFSFSSYLFLFFFATLFSPAFFSYGDPLHSLYKEVGVHRGKGKGKEHMFRTISKL